MTKLGDFLREQCAAAEPWNCSTMAADWCLLRGHPDFAAAWRDITDPDHCEAVQTDAGALATLWDHGIGDALPVVAEPEAGDIAVVALGDIEAGAIFTGTRWAIKGQRAVHFIAAVDLRAVKVWRP